MTTSAGIQQVRSSYTGLKKLTRVAESELPKNSDDLLRRNLDCAVIEFLHEVRDEAHDPPIDTVRGVFLEGGPIYEKSGFFEKNISKSVFATLNVSKVFLRFPQIN
ncbi:MAG: hypothetical protein RIF37_03380 [Rhodospirillaceae bacterium]